MSGIERDFPFYMSWLHRLIYRAAWPDFDCCQCIGQDYWQGCECHYFGAIAPGEGPSDWHLILRELWAVIARRGGYHDPGKR